MTHVLISSDGVGPTSLPLSPALRVGDWIFLSGQGGLNAANEIVGDTIETQTEATLQNIKRLLDAAGCQLSDVVTVLVHLADLTLFDGYNAVYEKFFSDPKPVRTTVGADLLHGLLVEITVTAHCGA
jgi:2-iminobutanoate/2-iminopropanoate deaminase